jgi:hypothetical protein
LSGVEIAMAVIGLLAVLTFLYAVIRVPILLRRGEVEPAGRDSDTFRRARRDRGRIRPDG